MDRISIFKPSLREVNNWLVRLVSEGQKMGLRDCLRGVKKGLVSLVSEEFENGSEFNFQTLVFETSLRGG